MSVTTKSERVRERPEFLARGYLMKRSTLGWVRRYYVLVGPRLYKYANKEGRDRQPQKVVDLSGGRIDTRGDLTFIVSSPLLLESLRFKADTVEYKEQWSSCLQRAVSGDFTTPSPPPPAYPPPVPGQTTNGLSAASSAASSQPASVQVSPLKPYDPSQHNNNIQAVGCGGAAAGSGSAIQQSRNNSPSPSAPVARKLLSVSRPATPPTAAGSPVFENKSVMSSPSFPTPIPNDDPGLISDDEDSGSDVMVV